MRLLLPCSHLSRLPCRSLRARWCTTLLTESRSDLCVCVCVSGRPRPQLGVLFPQGSTESNATNDEEEMKGRTGAPGRLLLVSVSSSRLGSSSRAQIRLSSHP